jgi:hypothetical protein
MDVTRNILTKLLGKIYLTKRKLLGLQQERITIVVSPSLRIFEIKTKPKSLKENIPFQEKKFISLDHLKTWATENGYTIAFFAETPKLKRLLYNELGDLITESDDEIDSQDNYIVILKEVDESTLPDSVKIWAKENPEKMMENLQRIRKLLS